MSLHGSGTAQEKETEFLDHIVKNKNNYEIIEQELEWLDSIIKSRIKKTAENDNKCIDIGPPNIEDRDTYYSVYIKDSSLTTEERIILLIALASDIKPEIFNQLSLIDQMTGNTPIEFGGLNSTTYRGFLPTIKTALFILAGNKIADQLKYEHLFDKQNNLYSRKILNDIPVVDSDPSTNKQVCLDESARSYITTGQDIYYEYSADFPASRLTTEMEWDDLVLHGSTWNSLKELLVWTEHGNKMTNDPFISKRVQPGHRALFYGHSGTGKTLTASLLGKKMNKPVYRIDLSGIVSKYVGETEKNLEKIFSTAEGRDWILFFDEADSLFGQRTNISSANDRFANQETSYLLQRIETFNNLVILASNLKKNIDKAFTRRFQSIVSFEMPHKEERLQIWKRMFNGNVQLDKSIDLDKLAATYDISGGSILNIMNYSALMTLADNLNIVTKENLMEGILKEYKNIGRTLSAKERL